MDTILIRKILCKLFKVVDNRLKFNDLYFLDEELVELFKRLETLNYHPTKE